MFKIVDVSDWDLLEVVTPGRLSKDWLINPETREHALFKRPNYHRAESASEKAAAEIGRLISIPTARTELANRQGEHGALSYKFLGKDEQLQDGGNLIIARYPNYDRHRGKEHSFQILEEILPPNLLRDVIDLIAFDALIGNTDRHQDNWSLIEPPPSRPRRLAPSYDHGTSLGSHIGEDQVERHLQPDQLLRYVKKGKALVGWREAGGTRRLRHVLLLTKAASAHRYWVLQSVRKLLSVDEGQLKAMLSNLPDEYADTRRKSLMFQIVQGRIQLLKEAFPDVA